MAVCELVRQFVVTVLAVGRCRAVGRHLATLDDLCLAGQVDLADVAARDTGVCVLVGPHVRRHTILRDRGSGGFGADGGSGGISTCDCVTISS